MYAVDPNGVRVDFEDSDGDSGSLVLMALIGMVFFPFMAFVSLTSNPQPIGFRGNLLVKRPKFFYCTYSLGITETS